MNLQTVVNAFTPLRIFYTATAILCAGFIGICLYKFPNPEGEIIALCYGQMAAHGVQLAGSVLMLALMLVVFLQVLVMVGPTVGVRIYRAIRDEREKRDAGFTLRTYRYEAKPPHVFIHTLLGEKEHETLARLHKALEETTTTKGCVLAMLRGSEMIETVYAGRQWASVPRSESGLLFSTYDADFRFSDEDEHTYFQAVEEVGQNWREKANAYVAKLAKQVNEEKSPLMIAARFAMSVLLVLLFPLLASAGISDEIRKGTPEAATLVPTKEVTFCFGQHSFTRKQTGQKTALELLVREGVPFNDDASVGEYIGVIIDGKLHQAVHANTEGKKPAALSSVPMDSTDQHNTLKEWDEETKQWVERQKKESKEWSNSFTIRTAISVLVFAFLLLGLWADVFHGEAMLDQFGQYIFGARFGGWANWFSFLTGVVGLIFVSILLLGVWWNATFNNDYWWAVRYIFSPYNLPVLATLCYRFVFKVGLNWLIPNNRRAHVEQHTPRTFSNNRQLGPGGN